jgi:dCTP deaminase
MILSDTRIREELAKKRIVIRPYRESCLGSNSYDVHLGPYLAIYRDGALDARRDNATDEIRMPKSGYVLVPGQLYLGVTEEYTETHAFVPFLEGKSSVGRLGIDIHSTAGKGDVGFCNYWTLELSVKLPVRIYPGMPIGQLIYFEVSGEVAHPYDRKSSAKYRRVSRHPMPSQMFRNFPGAARARASARSRRRR